MSLDLTDGFPSDPKYQNDAYVLGFHLFVINILMSGSHDKGSQSIGVCQLSFKISKVVLTIYGQLFSNVLTFDHLQKSLKIKKTTQCLVMCRGT